MNKQIEELIQKAVIEIITETASEKNIQDKLKLHTDKIHFVPVQYRVLGGLLQSLNIKFGNFIEKLISLVIEADPHISSLEVSGSRLPLSMTAQTDALIDRYITKRQLPESPDDCTQPFHELLQSIIEIEADQSLARQTIVKDVDVLFRIASGQTIYLEVKYNDDHDTGKFVDINRKFLKTYAGLVNHLNISNINQLKPIIYYFNPVKRWGSIYVPSDHIYRGSQLFEEYFHIKFAEVDAYLQKIGNDQKIIALFDDLYKRIRHG